MGPLSRFDSITEFEKFLCLLSCNIKNIEYLILPYREVYDNLN